MNQENVRAKLVNDAMMYPSIAAQARCIGISRSHMSRLLDGLVRPGPKVLSYLGLKEQRIYVDIVSEKE